MKILLAERFQRDLRKLSKMERVQCVELLLSLPRTIGHPHQHSGAGIRKLHRSGVYEARVGLGLRVVFALRNDQIVLVAAGSHDHVRKYLASV